MRDVSLSEAIALATERLMRAAETIAVPDVVLPDLAVDADGTAPACAEQAGPPGPGQRVVTFRKSFIPPGVRITDARIADGTVTDPRIQIGPLDV
jgi:hypothetical protein